MHALITQDWWKLYVFGETDITIEKRRYELWEFYIESTYKTPYKSKIKLLSTIKGTKIHFCGPSEYNPYNDYKSKIMAWASVSSYDYKANAHHFKNYAYVLRALK